MTRHRPPLRVVSDTPVPEDPPTDNHLDVIREDLDTIRGLVTETRAEAAVCEADGIDDVRTRLEMLDDAAGLAAHVVDETKARNP